VASLENRITPIVVLIGLAAINARGYWNVFTTHGATVRLHLAPPADTCIVASVCMTDE